MSECAGCRERDDALAERDARIEQLCTEARRIEEAKANAEVVLHDVRRRSENP